MSDDNTPMQHPFDTRGVLLLVGWLLITLSIILLVAMVYNWTGFVHFALVVTFYGPFFLGAIFGLVAIKLFLLPILERLWGFVERIRLFRYRQWKQGVIIEGNKTVINEEIVPYARVDTTKELTIQQRIETSERPNHLLLPAPVAQPPLLAKDLLPQLLALAETNWTQPWHDEKRWLLGQNTETRELVESLFMIELINIMIGGQPKRGKTNALRWLIMNMIASGGKFLLYDPHAEHLRRGLLAQLLPLRDFFYMPPVSAANETGVYHQFCQLRDIYVERELHNIEHPLLLTIADEYAELLSKLTNRARRREVETIIANVIKGGNKFGMLMLFANHNWQVSGIGGSETRDNITGALCFATAKSQYSMVLGTDEHEHLTSRPIAVGEAITKRMGYPLETIRLPLVEEDDLVTFAKEIKRLGTPATPETRRTHTSIFTAFTVREEEEQSNTEYSIPPAAPEQPTATCSHQHTRSSLEPLQPQSIHETAFHATAIQQPTGTEHHATSIEKSDHHATTPHNPRTTAHATINANLRYEQLRPTPTEQSITPRAYSLPTHQQQEQQEEEQKREEQQEEGADIPQRSVGTKQRRVYSPPTQDEIAMVVEAAERQSILYNGKIFRTEIMDDLKWDHDRGYWVIQQVCDANGWRRAKKPPFAREAWLAVIEYYGNVCLCCGISGDTATLFPDHVISRKHHGSDDISNRQPLCIECNGRKGEQDTDYRPAWEEAHRSEQKV